jgi:hypothetical protein
MGIVEWFLGTYFQWNKSDSKVSVHLSQTSFAAYMVEDNDAHLCNITPNATPYCSSLPINVIPESDKEKTVLPSSSAKENIKVWLA